MELPALPPEDGPAAPLPTALRLQLERLRLITALSGTAGSNRAPGRATRIAAADDLAAVTAWLARYADSAATLTAYRREVERLILWAVLQQGKPLSSLTHEELLAYERFLADPQPAARWVLAGSNKLARSHPDWRPFAGVLARRTRPPGRASRGISVTSCGRRSRTRWRPCRPTSPAHACMRRGAAAC